MTAERSESLADSYVQGWCDHWGPWIEILMDRTGLSRVEALLFLATMRLETLVQTFHNPQTSELQKIQADVLRHAKKHIEEEENGDGWKKP